MGNVTIYLSDKDEDRFRAKNKQHRDYIKSTVKKLWFDLLDFECFECELKENQLKKFKGRSR